MSKNDESKNQGKPGDTSQPGKKPTAIIDLKATEVTDNKGGSGSDKVADKAAGEKSAASAISGLKGAPGYEPPKASDKSAGKTAEAKSESGNSTAKAGSSSVPPVAGPGAAKAKDDPKSTPAATTSSSSGSSSSSPQKSSSSPSKSDPPAPPPPPRSSGGGILSTFTHMLAGLIGGGIALFGIEPLEKQLDFKLLPERSVPPAIERRLSSLEQQGTAQPASVATAEDIAAVQQKLAAADKRITAVEGLANEVASLRGDLDKIAAQPSAPAVDGSGSAVATADVDALRQRLAKLESSFSTLSSATNTDGQQAGIAPLASLSGKLADVETKIDTELASLRERLLSDVDKRISGTAETSAAAAAGTKRLDRELSDLKTDNARLAQQARTLKTANDKLTATVRVLEDEAAGLKVALDSLKGEVSQQFTKVARPDDVTKALVPVTAKVALIEKDLSTVVESERSRKANAERIVLSLELANLKRVLDRGVPYETELAEVKKVAGEGVDLSSLEAYKSDGVPSVSDLSRQFQKVAYEIIGAESQPADSSDWMGRLMAGAQSVVQIRRTDLPPDAKTTEAAVARIEKLLKSGDLSGALTIARKLPEKSRAPAENWIKKLAARADVDRAISKVEGQLKASLGGGRG